MAQAKTFAEKLMRHHGGEFRAVAAVARTSVEAGRPEAALAVAERYTPERAIPRAGDHLTRSGRVAELLDELARLPNVRGTPAGRAIDGRRGRAVCALVSGRPEAIIGIVGVLAADGRATEGFARIETTREVRSRPRVRAAAGLAAVRAGGVYRTAGPTVLGWIDECLKEEPTSPTLL